MHAQAQPPHLRSIVQSHLQSFIKLRIQSEDKAKTRITEILNKDKQEAFSLCGKLATTWEGGLIWKQQHQHVIPRQKYSLRIQPGNLSDLLQPNHSLYFLYMRRRTKACEAYS